MTHAWARLWLYVTQFPFPFNIKKYSCHTTHVLHCDIVAIKIAMTQYTSHKYTSQKTTWIDCTQFKTPTQNTFLIQSSQSTDLLLGTFNFSFSFCWASHSRIWNIILVPMYIEKTIPKRRGIFWSESILENSMCMPAGPTTKPTRFAVCNKKNKRQEASCS